ncbi:hypothetical protein GCM10009865_02900 [Aeromicrobium ponti]
MDAKTLNQWPQFSFVAGLVCLFSGTAFTIAIGEIRFIFLCAFHNGSWLEKGSFQAFFTFVSRNLLIFVTTSGLI